MWARRRGPVRGHAGDDTARLPEQGRHLGRVVGRALGQHVGRDLAGVGVNGQVQLQPAPFGPAVPLGIPFALAEQLQAGAVEHQVHGATACSDTGLSASKGLAAAGQRRVVRPGQGVPEQAQHAGRERRRLAQGEVEDEAQRQHHLDRQVRVEGLTAWCRPSRRVPPGQGRLIQPEGQVTTPPQPGFVCGPVLDAVARFRDAVAAGGVVCPI